MENLRFKGKNKDFKAYLDEAIQKLNEQEKRSCTSANVHTPVINTSTKLYRKFLV